MREIIISTSHNIQHFTAVGVKFEYITEITCHSNYSGITFKNGYRSTANFSSATLAILDFDGNLPLEEAKALFSDKKAIIVTTKSHQCGSKNGKAIAKQDRFRAILQFDETITCPYKYQKVMKNLVSEYSSDEACVDGARFFYPNPYQTQWISSGNELIDTTFYAALPTKGRVRQSDTTLKLFDITLEGNIDITSVHGLTLSASKWAQELDADATVTVHCPNPEHPDLNPSAFIAHTTSDESKIFIFCHVCGALGTFPSITNPFSNAQEGKNK
jgi:hypothetical protein